MKAHLLLEVYAPKRCDFEKDIELDFLPTKGLAFHLLEGVTYEIDADVDNVHIFITEEPYFMFVTFESLDMSDGIKSDEDWDTFVNEFIANGWKTSFPKKSAFD